MRKLAFIVLVIGVIAGVGGLAVRLTTARPQASYSAGPNRLLRAAKTAPAGIRFFKKVATNKKLVAITFDDGPDPRFTLRILDILKAEKVKATFFVTGKAVRNYPDILRREAAEGHLIGNHTWEHYHLTELSARRIGEEIDRTGEEIARILGARPVLMRPPYGQMNEAVYREAAKRGYTVALWSSSFQEMRYPHPLDAAEYIASRVEPGDVILGHDGGLKYHERGVEMLPLLIRELRKKGYRMVRLDELLEEGRALEAESGKRTEI
ncbi:MAG: polysaccharide deacetylase family protein [Candidatus Aquicultorales bacterium]